MNIRFELKDTLPYLLVAVAFIFGTCQFYEKEKLQIRLAEANRTNELARQVNTLARRIDLTDQLLQSVQWNGEAAQLGKAFQQIGYQVRLQQDGAQIEDK